MGYDNCIISVSVDGSFVVVLKFVVERGKCEFVDLSLLDDELIEFMNVGYFVVGLEFIICLFFV